MSDIADKAARFEEMFVNEGIANAVSQLDETQELDGDVVVCACCGEPIPLERLKVLPNATLCVDCKAVLEKS